jgi:hypothetical protein
MASRERSVAAELCARRVVIGAVRAGKPLHAGGGR